METNAYLRPRHDQRPLLQRQGSLILFCEIFLTQKYLIPWQDPKKGKDMKDAVETSPKEPQPKTKSKSKKPVVEPETSPDTTKKARALQEEEPKAKRGKTTKPAEAEVAPKKTKAKCFDPKYIKNTAKAKAKASPKAKSVASPKAVKPTIDKKPKRKGKSKSSKKAKKDWETEMLEEEVEEEAQPAEDFEIQERPGVAVSDEPGSEHDGGDDECEAPATPAVAETQMEPESHNENVEVKEEEKKSDSDSQQSLATLLRGNEQMLAQSLCSILESQAQSSNSQTESQLFAGMLGSDSFFGITLKPVKGL